MEDDLWRPPEGAGRTGVGGAWDAPAAHAPVDPDELDMLPLDPRVRSLWRLTGVLSAVPIVVVTALADWAVPHPLPPGLLTVLVLAVAAAAVAVVPAVRYRRWRYALQERCLWIRQGLWQVTVSVIPYRRLQFVDTRQGPLDRLFGLAQLVVHTAALGTSGRVPGLDVEQAEDLRARLSELEGDGGV